jgi:ferredoxin-NADP reductase
MRADMTWVDATVRRIRDVTPGIRQIEIVPEGNAVRQWTPGSHIEVGVVIDGRADTRFYSLVGDADPACYRIAVKREDPSRGGSRYMWSLAPGARIKASAPRNLFELELGRPEYLLIAGGIGITPVYGMALGLARQNASFRLLYACRSRQDAAFLPELAEALENRLVFFAEDEGQRIDLAAEVGRLHAGAQLYVCGPMGLLDALRHVWAQAGRRPSELRYESFANSGHHAPEPFWLRVPSRGIEITVRANQTILDALNEAGAEVMFDCRRGECGLCVVDVIALIGAIDHRDVFFSDHQRKANTQLCACVSRVVGGGAVLDIGYREDAI